MILKELRVLVVDDDEDELVLLREQLSGFLVKIAETSQEALARMSEGRFDVALVDVRLGPDLGTDLAGELKKVDPKMAILLHTAFPESYLLDKVEGGVEGYLLKGSDERHLRSVLQNAVHVMSLSAEERLQRESLFLQLEPACGDTIHDYHFELTESSKFGISERWLVRWKKDMNHDIEQCAMVPYRLRGHSAKSVTFALPTISNGGCGLGCQFCLNAHRPRSRGLTENEILDMFMLASNSVLARAIFRMPGLADVRVNFTCDEPMFNIKNVSGAIRRLAEIGQPGIRFVFTSIGLEDHLRVFIDRYIDLPRVGHYFSANSFREMRGVLMPATKKQNLSTILDLYSLIFRLTGEKVTASIILLPGYNDQKEDIEAIVRAIGHRPEFLIKLQAFSGAPGFEPFETASEKQLKNFRRRLIAAGIDPARIRIKYVIGGGAYSGCGTTVPGFYRSRQKEGNK